jgi:hypothetical protein
MKEIRSVCNLAAPNTPEHLLVRGNARRLGVCLRKATLCMRAAATCEPPPV